MVALDPQCVPGILVSGMLWGHTIHGFFLATVLVDYYSMPVLISNLEGIIFGVLGKPV